jgi:hypothetical protein
MAKEFYKAGTLSSWDEIKTLPVDLLLISDDKSLAWSLKFSPEFSWKDHYEPPSGMVSFVIVEERFIPSPDIAPLFEKPAVDIAAILSALQLSCSSGKTQFYAQCWQSLLCSTFLISSLTREGSCKNTMFDSDE